MCIRKCVDVIHVVAFLLYQKRRCTQYYYIMCIFLKWQNRYEKHMVKLKRYHLYKGHGNQRIFSVHLQAELQKAVKEGSGVLYLHSSHTKLSALKILYIINESSAACEVPKAVVDNNPSSWCAECE